MWSLTGMSSEEERAREYRRQQLARERNDKAAERALRGSTVARKALKDAWDPVSLALEEAAEPPGDRSC